jgi:long-chain acyl-CoA synthetase
VALRFGTTLVLEDEFSLRRMANALREHEVTFCPGTPAMYEALVQPSSGKLTAARGARFLSGGSALSSSLAQRFHERFGARLLSCYHTTEAGPISLDRRGLSPESVGKPLAGVRLKVGANGQESGPLWVRSPTVSCVLVGARQRRDSAVPIGGIDANGWLRTGDMARSDRGGRWYLMGREDDVVKVDGRRVALGEVEACLAAFPKVIAARAEILRDPLAGTFVAAQIVPSGDCAAEEIIDHCARNLASYKVPRRVRFVKELVC